MCVPSWNSVLSPNIQMQILQTDLHTFPWLREFVCISTLFPSGDYFINSHNIFPCLCIAVVGRKLTLVILGTLKG